MFCNLICTFKWRKILIIGIFSFLFYLSFLSRGQSLLAACGAIHSGMVEGTAWSVSDFVKVATKSGGSFSKAARAVKWGRTLAAGVAAAKEQLSGVPLVSLAGSVLEYV